MLLLRQGNVQPIEENGLMLAAFDFAKYSNAARTAWSRAIDCCSTPMGSSKRRMLSGTSLGRILCLISYARPQTLSPSEAADRIIASVAQWAVSQDDDLTVLVCDYVGTPRQPLSC